VALALLLLTATSAFAKDVWLRETHFVIYEVQAGEEVAFTMTPQARGTASPQPMQWRIYDADGAIIAEGAPQSGTVTVSYTPREGGLNIARLVGNRNWYVLSLPDDRYGIVSSNFAHLHTRGDAKPTYFFVPEGVERVEAFVLADSPREGAIIRLLDADGEVAAEKSGQFDRATKVVADVTQGQAGRVWSIQLAPAEGMSFDDVVIWFEADGPIPPLTSYSPEALKRLLDVIPGALP
jgi:hypothetical protein